MAIKAMTPQTSNNSCDDFFVHTYWNPIYLASLWPTGAMEIPEMWLICGWPDDEAAYWYLTIPLFVFTETQMQLRAYVKWVDVISHVHMDTLDNPNPKPKTHVQMHVEKGQHEKKNPFFNMALLHLTRKPFKKNVLTRFNLNFTNFLYITDSHCWPEQDRIRPSAQAIVYETAVLIRGHDPSLASHPWWQTFFVWWGKAWGLLIEWSDFISCTLCCWMTACEEV